MDIREDYEKEDYAEDMDFRAEIGKKKGKWKESRLLRVILSLLLTASTLVGSFAGMNFLDNVAKMDNLAQQNNVTEKGDFSRSTDFSELMDGYLQLLELSLKFRTYLNDTTPYQGAIENMPFLETEKGKTLTLGEVSKLGGHGYDYKAYLDNFLKGFEGYSREGISLLRLMQQLLEIDSVLVSKDGKVYWMAGGEDKCGLSDKQYRYAMRCAKKISKTELYSSSDTILPSFWENKYGKKTVKVLMKDTEQEVELSTDYQRWIFEKYPKYAQYEMKYLMAEACEKDFKGTSADGMKYSACRKPVYKDYRKAHYITNLWMLSEAERDGQDDETIIVEDDKGKSRSINLNSIVYINHGKTEIVVSDFLLNPDKYYNMLERHEDYDNERVYDVSLEEYAAQLKKDAQQHISTLEQSVGDGPKPWTLGIPLCDMDMMADIAQFYISFSRGLEDFLAHSSFVYTIKSSGFEVSSANSHWREFIRQERNRADAKKAAEGEEKDPVAAGEKFLYASYDANGSVYWNNMFWDSFYNSGSLSGYLVDMAAPYANVFCAVGIDLNEDSLVASDNVIGNAMRRYRQNQADYRKSKAEAITFLGWFGVSAFLILLCLLMLSVMAGHGDRGRLVLWIDRIYVEILVFVACLCGILMFSVVEFFNLYGGMGQLQWTSVQVQLLYPCGLTVDALFLYAIWLSMVRRVKNKSLRKNSLIFHGMHRLKKVWVRAWHWLQVFGGRCRNQKAFVRYGVVGIVWLLIWGTLGIIFLSIHDGYYYGSGMTGFGILAGMALFFISFQVLLQGLCNALAEEEIMQGAKRIADGDFSSQISTDHSRAGKEQRELIQVLNHIGEGLERAIDESVRSERMKTELITNVSHDIKTPLTSVINYVDLLKREEIDNARAREYLEVLDQKSQRLKDLIEDLVEASKASSGAMELQITELNFNELIHQTDGEFEEKFEAAGLTLLSDIPKEAVCFRGDGRRVYRILENLYGNVAKYAMPGTRVYTELSRETDDETGKSYARFTVKNISKEPLNVTPEELTERFVRGDVSRTTEGSGLGLSITKSLTELMKGDFEIYLDGDLFRVTLTFPAS